MVSLWMVEILVELICQKRKLSNASLEEIHFWTENAETYLVDLNDANGADLLELRFCLGGL
jgi:hypothetical protein